ncbi:hypothetical protein IMZ08_03770 [Bacillus luteolus]|uniref:histidine kinase n=1 Tax=Litchfieldia luteola TaxID=682179 RepID=A0ABR9QFA8_9BACI|nr:ATP-binding protein [Cytobacillus luteolus]MBE4907176.1 hypothetical protein [Cytobacillus luteolus]MBP1943353.1 signal transduction histidine kinase [Cytobacillus luteolus]
MSTLYKELNVFVIGIRWVLLFTGLLTYTNGDGVIDLSFLLIVVINFYYSVLINKKFSNKILVMLVITIDLCANLFLLWQTGGLDSPFLYYSITSLLWFKNFFAWKKYYLITSIFLLLLPIVLSSLYQVSVGLYLSKNVDYTFYLIVFYSMVFTLNLYSTYISKHYKKLVHFYSFTGSEELPSYEKLLSRMVEKKQVYLCLNPIYATHINNSWEQNYYYNYLVQQFGQAKISRVLNISSYSGERKTFYVHALNDKNWGYLLVEGSNQVSMATKIYTKLISQLVQIKITNLEQVEEVKKKALKEERDKIAQDIHDGIAQQLFFISIQLFQLKNKLPEDTKRELESILNSVETQVKETHQGIRNYIGELKNEKRQFHLFHAVENLLERLTENKDIEPRFIMSGWIPEEKIEIEESIFHLIEEASNNVIKHANASELQVSIEVSSIQWKIMIRDNGKGIENLAVSKGKRDSYGLGGMVDRIEKLGGTLTIKSETNKGTTVLVFIPRERSRAYA